MLSAILSKSDCASCKFCCSFRRQSLWESPVFDKESTQKLQKLFPKAKFRPVKNDSFTFDIYDQYKTDNPDEEAPCPFLDSSKGCLLPAELKPFDCSIWPLRAVRHKDGSLYVALTPTCPAINKVPLQKVCELAESGLGQKILDYAKNHPEIIKEYSDFLGQNVYPKKK